MFNGPDGLSECCGQVFHVQRAHLLRHGALGLSQLGLCRSLVHSLNVKPWKRGSLLDGTACGKQGQERQPRKLDEEDAHGINAGTTGGSRKS